MSFIWPSVLPLVLVGVPVAIAAYLAILRRREQRAAELAAQGFVPTASSRRARGLRHIPFAFFMAALVFVLVGAARPQMRISVPHREGTVILAFDVSNSMLAKDLEPSRMEAAKVAARAFVENQPSSVKVGVVAFSDGGLVTLPPTNAQADVLSAIDRLQPSGATSLGQGMFTALNAIAGKPITVDPTALEGNIDDIDVPYLGSAAVILLSDGENTANPDPLDVAELAAVAGVHVYPVGIGSPEGTVVEIEGFNVATALDEDLLEQIASVTDGTYFHADDAASLTRIYDNIDLKLTSEPKTTEVTGVLTGLSTLCLVVGGVLSLIWFGRVA
jgi:Ca-activated chloride channel homolog